MGKGMDRKKEEKKKAGQDAGRKAGGEEGKEGRQRLTAATSATPGIREFSRKVTPPVSGVRRP